MSEKIASLTYKRRRRCSEKVPVEIGEKKSEIASQCSKKTVENGAQDTKPSGKVKSNAKCRKKDRNNVTKSTAVKSEERNKDIDHVVNKIKNLTIEKSSLEASCSQRLRNKIRSNDRNCQEPVEHVSKQKKKQRHKSNETVQRKAQQHACKGNGTTKHTVINTPKFPEHIPLEEIDDILKKQNSTDAEYVEGYLRINPRCYKYSYVSLPDNRCDLLIFGLRDRNRAFDGDLVVARVNPPEKWQQISEEETQKTGVVVCIREEVHPRKAIGHLKKQHSYIFFYPRDQRVPLVKIYPELLPKNCVAKPDLYKNTLFLVNISKWKTPQFAVGDSIEVIGNTDDIAAQSLAILLEQDLNVTPYSPELTQGLPSGDYVLTESDMEDREDWRQECVFTIDPDTAVDLDDAVSCKLLENGNYEIGVHIADVTHYLEFLSELDIEVAKRATTIYMTDNVYHMLPKELCQLCSLLPGKDRLSFSVIWEMTPDTKIVKHRFAKTVMRSCCQMAYQHAQNFIENPVNEWPDNFLSVNGNFTVNDLSLKVNILHKLATQMRGERFANGALQIDLPKFHVLIDKITKLPVTYSIEERKDSNRLIEEFMLLANMTVATHLYQAVPETALLRNHRGPSTQVLSRTKDILQSFGIHIDIQTAASLQASLERDEQEVQCESSEVRTILKYRMMVIKNMLSKAMARATYICASTVETVEELRHYSLNVPLYTHFTSPIRRYSDCVVHRLLYATMNDAVIQGDSWKKSVIRIARNCNVKKYSAKVAQEESNKLYYTYLVHLGGPTVQVGIVLDVKETSMDVILCDTGIKLRIYFADLENLKNAKYSSECSVSTISLTWKQPVVTEVINVFTLLDLEIRKHPEFFKLIGVPLPPIKPV